YAAHGTGLAKNLLRERERRDDLVVFDAAGRKNAANADLTPGQLDSVARLRAQFCGQTFAEQHILRIIRRPSASWRLFAISTRNLPPRIRDAHASGEVVFPETERLIKISAKQGDILRAAPAADLHRHRQHRRKTYNVVVPERPANFRQILLVEKIAVARR